MSERLSKLIEKEISKDSGYSRPNFKRLCINDMLKTNQEFKYLFELNLEEMSREDLLKLTEDLLIERLTTLHNGGK